LQAASLSDKIRDMNMKLMTVLAVASVAFAGAACSESTTKASSENTDQVAVEAPSGTLNLSLGSSVSETQAAGGTLNLNLGGASDQPRLIGSDQLGSVDFNQDVPAPVFTDSAAQPAAGDQDDDIIRLDPN